jgi:murein endopeptidase
VQAGIELLETVRGDSDEFDQAIHLIEKPARRAQTPLGVLLDGILRVPRGGQMKADGGWHQAGMRERS